jgi:tetratricopeptide (TPR) repeat protein
MESICNDPFVYQILSPFGLTANLFTDTQNAIEIVMKDEQWGEFPVLINHYMYRLFKSVKMINTPLANQQTKQNAFLLYLSSLCDESNTNQFGAILLYSFLRAIGKTELAEFDQAGIKSEFLASNPDLLRKLLHSDFHQAVKICEEHSDDEKYALLKEELKRKGDQFNDPATNANEFLRRHMPDEKILEAIELLANALDRFPLDKESLLYKLYLLTLQGDMQTTLETAETLRVFYPDDCTALIVVAHTFACAGQKEQAKQILKKALNMNMDETKQLEITRIIEDLKQFGGG